MTRARELHAAGQLTVQEIADAVGCSRATLYRELGDTKPSTKPSSASTTSAGAR